MSDIDEVKSRLNIVDVIAERVPLKKAGRHFKALCPFHSEKTPSFIVSPERQIWKCFGCGKGGSVIDFVMEYEHIDFVEALEELAEKAGVKLERRPPDSPEAKLKQKIYEVNHLASEFYHYLLTKHALGEKARAYLSNRGVTDKSVKTFTLGYSPNSWEGLLKYLKKKGYDEELLEKAGLVVRTQNSELRTQNRYYDRFRGRVMFTLKDHRGNVVGFSGRLLDPNAKEAKYINTSETPVYSKSNVLYGLDVTREAIKKEGQAIVMEGEFDTISSFQAGIANVVAIKGSALTERHVNLLRRFTERLVFALDSDLAGDAAARRGIEIADRAGLDMEVVLLPPGKDPDEVARENPGLWEKAIKEAIPVYDYFINSALKRFETTTAFGKRKAGEELLPIIGKIDNPIVQGHYLKILAAKLDATEEAIREALEKTIAATTGRVPEGKETPGVTTTVSLSRSEKLELYALSLLLQGQTAELFDELTDQVAISEFTHPAVVNIFNHLKTFLKNHRVFLIKDFADSLPKELLVTLDSAFLWDVAQLLTDEERFAKEWHKVLDTLKREMLRRKIQAMTKIVRQHDPKDEKKLQAFQAELKQLTEQLKDLEKLS